MKLNDEKRTLVTELVAKYGNIVTRQQLVDHVKSKGVQFNGSRAVSGSGFPAWITNTKALRAGRGQYDLSSLVNGETEKTDANDSNGVEFPRVALP